MATVAITECKNGWLVAFTTETGPREEDSVSTLYVETELAEVIERVRMVLSRGKK